MLPFRLYTWDLETYLHCFLFSGKFEDEDTVYTFEMSRRRNDRDALLAHLNYIKNTGAVMCGYNSLGFDYPVAHELLNSPYTFDAKKAYQLGTQIITSGNYGNAGNLMIPMRDRLIPQVDWVKINHFDNANKRVSLKSLQFAMRSHSLEDLPFPVDKDLTDEEIEKLRSYNMHDVTETEKFGKKCKHLLEMRQQLLTDGVLSGDVLNYSDVKIGIEYLIRRIGRAKCFISGSKPKQTFRTEVVYKSVILPKIKFKSESYNATLDWFKSQTLYIASEVRPKLETTHAGLPFHFGVGGVHASVENKAYASNPTHVIKDIDVSGMYVAVAIANGFAPEHLGLDFVTAYRSLQRDRAQYAKGSTMNGVLKLAGNGVYGNSNNPYSCFYDPQYTFTVTLNGQLQLLQLVELLSLIPGLELIQANTDGITVYMPRDMDSWFQLWKSEWEQDTGLKLEEVTYSHMWIRDVNNYIAVTVDGKIKLKGAYWYPKSEAEYDGWWNKDFSMLAVQKVTEQVLITGNRVEDVIKLVTNPFDFMLRYKTPGGAKVYIGEKEMLKTVRYYVSTRGEPMKKVSKPTGPIGSYKRKNKLTDDEYNTILASLPPDTWDERIHNKKKTRYTLTTTAVHSGYKVRECNVATDFDWSDVDYSFYIEEIRKLLIGRTT